MRVSFNCTGSALLASCSLRACIAVGSGLFHGLFPFSSNPQNRPAASARTTLEPAVTIAPGIGLLVRASVTEPEKLVANAREAAKSSPPAARKTHVDIQMDMWIEIAMISTAYIQIGLYSANFIARDTSAVS